MFLLPILLLFLLLDHLLPLNSSCLVQFGIAPLVGAGIATGVGSLLGNIFGTKSSNSQNMNINKMNNDFNAREAEKAR